MLATAPVNQDRQVAARSTARIATWLSSTRLLIQAQTRANRARG